MSAFINLLPFGKFHNKGVALRCSNIKCTATPVGQPQQSEQVSRAVVWFREGDLRLQDHPGLEAASEHTSSALAHLLVCTPTTSKATLAAATRLKHELQARGSHLSVRFANDEADAVVAFLNEFAAERVHVRMDVETDARRVVKQVERAVDGTSLVSTWTADLRQWDNLTAEQLSTIPDTYPAFLQWRPRASAPIITPSHKDDLRPLIPTSQSELTDDDPDAIESVAKFVNQAASVDHWNHEFPQRYEEEKKLSHTIELPSETPNFGEALLQRYLKCGEENKFPDFGRSLSEIFRQGALSPRRMRQIVIDFESKSGRIFPFLYQETAKLVLSALDAQEFSTLLARRDVQNHGTVDGEHEAKFWRWNGFLIRYVEEGVESAGAKGGIPPIVLIHGFGASSFHYEKSIRLLKNQYHVFAIDCIGFGRSDKPPMQYTVALWEAMVWDFIRDVVRQRVYVAGNSIGGIFASAFGTDAYPTLSAGICLINTAGPIDDEPNVPGKTDTGWKYFLRWRWIRTLAGRFILRSLQGRVARTLNIVYPTNRLDENSKLPQEIMRASYDYGAAGVISSGLTSPRARSYRKLLGNYDGPLLIFNGLLDPLGNVRLRTTLLQDLYPLATVETVDAGHCPHDEVPEEFVRALTAWVEKNETSKNETCMAESDEAKIAPVDTR